MKAHFAPSTTEPIPLDAIDSWPATRHLFDEDSVWAVRAALAAGRPLLLRGEPGIGKSQLARAVAQYLKVPFLYQVVDERSERDDLLYTYDAVSRLAQAQVLSVVGQQENWEEKMKEDHFIKPGAIWWAYDWKSAIDQAKDYFRACEEPQKPKRWTWTVKPGYQPTCGPVVLIDEIDKADSSVPNGLLECLGNQGFQTAQLGRAVRLPDGAAPPLIIITTNEERELPAAFLRRCLVLHMKFPPAGITVRDFLLRRARVHWGEDEISDSVCELVCRSLMTDRDAAKKLGIAKPGAAEYLDLIRILVEMPHDNESQQIEAFNRVKDFALQKNITENL